MALTRTSFFAVFVLLWRTAFQHAIDDETFCVTMHPISGWTPVTSYQKRPLYNDIIYESIKKWRKTPLPNYGYPCPEDFYDSYLVNACSKYDRAQMYLVSFMFKCNDVPVEHWFFLETLAVVISEEEGTFSEVDCPLNVTGFGDGARMTRGRRLRQMWDAAQN